MKGCADSRAHALHTYDAFFTRVPLLIRDITSGERSAQSPDACSLPSNHTAPPSGDPPPPCRLERLRTQTQPRSGCCGKNIELLCGSDSSTAVFQHGVHQLCQLQVEEQRRTADTLGRYAFPTTFASWMSLSSSHRKAQSHRSASKCFAIWMAAPCLPLPAG